MALIFVTAEHFVVGQNEVRGQISGIIEIPAQECIDVFERTKIISFGKLIVFAPL